MTAVSHPGEPKNHHLLPRFYLSGFCNPNIHKAENHERDRSRCRVWVHDKEADEGQTPIRQRGVKNLSVKRHYYSVDTVNGVQDAKPERVLADVEGGAAAIIRSLRYGSKLHPQQKATLAIFMALMKFRVSSYRIFSRVHVARNEDRIRASAFPSAETLAKDLRSAGHAAAEDPELVERIWQEIRSGERELNLTKNHDIQHMFQHSHKVAKVLFDSDWTLAWAPNGTSFVTSDDPVLILDEKLKAPKSFIGEVGFASPHSTKVLPLKQDVCLIVGSGAHEIRHGEIDRDGVRHLNLQQTPHYDRWLIAGDKALIESISRRRG